MAFGRQSLSGGLRTCLFTQNNDLEAPLVVFAVKSGSYEFEMLKAFGRTCATPNLPLVRLVLVDKLACINDTQFKLLTMLL